jgi:hypothetical protein
MNSALEAQNKKITSDLKPKSESEIQDEIRSIKSQSG